ncbi:MAG: DMT family transporter [Planctomycetes bacterium]|nr:DMT family transporter [Planctomycetota bacterium]
MAPSALRVHSALLLVSLLFGANYPFTKQLLATVPVGAWVVFRIAAAAVLMLPLAAWLGRGHPWPRSRHWPLLALASLLGLVGNQVLFTEGLARTTPEHSAVVNACIPMWTLLAAAALGQERLGLGRIAAIVSALAGVSWLLGVDRILFAGASDAGASLVGDLLTMANGMSFALHLVLLRQVGKGLSPWHTTALMFAFGTPMVACYGGTSIDAAAIDAVLTPPAAWFALYGIVGCTVVSYLLNTWALRHTHSSQVALYINVQPLVAAAVNAGMGAGLPGHRFFVAFALVAFGLWLHVRSAR